jgi:hypothetical protein
MKQLLLEIKGAVDTTKEQNQIANELMGPNLELLEYFPTNRSTLLVVGFLPCGERLSFGCRLPSRGTLDQGPGSRNSQAEMADDRFLGAA